MRSLTLGRKSTAIPPVVTDPLLRREIHVPPEIALTTKPFPWT
jgi:hypothetical protein